MTMFFTILLFVFCSFSSVSQTNFNKVDDKGQKHGLWKGFFEGSKRPKYEGTFEHGKEIGFFKFFDDTKSSSIVATREFNSDGYTVHTIFYDQNKNIVSEGKVVNKVFEGQWNYYHLASRNIMTTEHYSKGMLQGLRTVFYLNGIIAEEISYNNNSKNGLYKKYTEKGILLEESVYKDDKYHGIAIFRNSNGNMVSRGQFVNGKKSGIWQFFENGKVIKERNMSFPENATKLLNN